MDIGRNILHAGPSTPGTKRRALLAATGGGFENEKPVIDLDENWQIRGERRATPGDWTLRLRLGQYLYI
jgi:hypothetical protein